MRDCLRRGTPHPHFHFNRVVQTPCRQSFNFLRNRRREEKCLPLLRTFFDNSPDIGKKAHVQHPIDLIEDEKFKPREVERAALHVIEQPARCGHDDIKAPAESLVLPAVANSPVDQSHLEYA